MPDRRFPRTRREFLTGSGALAVAGFLKSSKYMLKVLVAIKLSEVDKP